MIYLFEPLAEDFSIRAIDEPNVGKRYPKRVSLFGKKSSKLGSDQTFIICAQCIAGGELPQRKLATGLINKRSRNLTTNVEITRDYLATMLPSITTTKGKKSMDIIHAEQELNICLPPIKQTLGWPEINPVEFSFRITQAVLNATDDPLRRKAIEAEIPCGIIFLQRLERIIDRWKGDFGDQADPIIDALRATANRDHLSLISLAANHRDQPRLLIVDEAKNRLVIPAWKFVDLLANPDLTRRLYTFTAEYQRERYPEVVFNNESSGDLVAKFEPSDSSLRVMTVTGNNKDQRSIANSRIVTFYLDQDYVVCLWLVLNRLISDRMRFDALLEQAEAQTELDPFKLLQ